MKMTVKQIAELAGCSSSCVTKYSNQLYPGMKSGKGNKKYFNQEQATEIMKVIPVKNSDLVISGEDSEVRKVEIRTSELSKPAEEDNGVLSAIREIQADNREFMLKVIEIITPASPTPIKAEIEAPCPAPRLSAPAPEMSSRDRINKIVRGYCAEQRIPYRDGWDRLYIEHKYRCNKDLKLKAKNRGMSTMDLFVKDGEIHNLLAIALEIYGE